MSCERRQATSLPATLSAPVAEVRTQTAANKEDTDYQEVVGTIRAKLRATLEAKLSGRITEMPIALGQSVKAGQLMARLDAVEIQARFDQAEAGLEQAERDLKRLSALFAQQAVSRSEYETAESHFEIAKGALAEAQAVKGYVEIIAPFQGVVTRKWADVGDLAAPGKPLIDLEDPSALQLEAEMPESSASHIQKDGRMSIVVDGLDRGEEGIVSEIGPLADPLTRTFRVKLDLANMAEARIDAQNSAGAKPSAGGAPFLMSGRFARLLVPVGKTSAVRVPASAVVCRGQLELVFVVADNHAQLRLAKTGKRVGDETEILAGLDPGEVVVTDHAQELTDGQAVHVK